MFGWPGNNYAYLCVYGIAVIFAKDVCGTFSNWTLNNMKWIKQTSVQHISFATRIPTQLHVSWAYKLLKRCTTFKCDGELLKPNCIMQVCKVKYVRKHVILQKTQQNKSISGGSEPSWKLNIKIVSGPAVILYKHNPRHECLTEKDMNSRTGLLCKYDTIT